MFVCVGSKYVCVSGLCSVCVSVLVCGCWVGVFVCLVGLGLCV